MKYSLLFLIPLLLTFSCDKLKSSKIEPNCENIKADNADQCLRLNQIQVLGTHNSYKLKPSDSLIQKINRETPGWSTGLEYEHRPLSYQLENLGIRKFELDIYADTAGGLFANPKGAQLIGDGEYLGRTEMQKPGFKVIHIQDIDYRSTCLTLVDCLQEIKDWSVQNPKHLPIMIMLEVKQGTPSPRGSFTFTKALDLNEELVKGVDDEIWSVFEKDHAITPDDVRGNYDTLEEAILTNGWPSLEQSRGKVIFALDNTNEVRNLYLAGNEVLQNRAAFVSSYPGESTAGFIKMNDVPEQGEEIKEYVEKGYIIRTRADIPTQEARSGDTTRRDLALQSGAHYISTDYPEASPFDSTYIVRLPGTNNPGRCNPVSAPSSCKNEFITE
ncbi:phosphatidylinositol-specific phospholipase C1-like protein [Gracilimonas mengyeensis]|uniref:Phosphoinositide phospholipase C, Ca2+-dependent n=1 Tax=Gracilimonas mengyeensis TaxID=1302730 RepID=A0A521CQZ3_9BACT|nr:phosphatidylinositol-specific phospholipase C1-like protein [Gracilimonas mengyeensis]SMO61828.1 Phosphoinositide phospholipase C, Ca2+-dependent [Gracilimonas mengyeensis]